MCVSSYPDDHYFEDMRGAAYATICVWDTDRVIQRVLHLIPRQKLTEMFVEIKYLQSVLNFSRKWFIFSLFTSNLIEE